MSDKKKISGASLRHAFDEIIWPRRKLILLGLVLILLNRLSGLVLPASTKYLVDDVISGGTGAPLQVARVGGPRHRRAVGHVLRAHHAPQRRGAASHRQPAGAGPAARAPAPGPASSTTPSPASWSRASWTTWRACGTWSGRGWCSSSGARSRPWSRSFFLIRIDPIMTAARDHPACSRSDGVLEGVQHAPARLPGAGPDPRRSDGAADRGARRHPGHQGLPRAGEGSEIFDAGVLRIFDNVKTTLTTSSAVTSLGTFFMGLASVLIMGYGGRLDLQDQLTLGELFSFTLFLGFLIAPVVQMANIGTQMTEAFAGLDRTSELLTLAAGGRRPACGPRPCRPSRGTSRFEDVHFAYEADKPVLHGISFEARPGHGHRARRQLGLRASRPSPGSRRRSSSPDEGRVLVDGVDLRRVNLGELPRAARTRVPGRLPVRRHHPREPSLRAPDRHRSERSRTRRGRRM